MSTDRQIKQEQTIKELLMMVEILYHQGILSESVFSGLRRRLGQIEANPYALLTDLENKDIEVLVLDKKYKLHLTVTPID